MIVRDCNFTQICAYHRCACDFFVNQFPPHRVPLISSRTAALFQLTWILIYAECMYSSNSPARKSWNGRHSRKAIKLQIRPGHHICVCLCAYRKDAILFNLCTRHASACLYIVEHKTSMNFNVISCHLVVYIAEFLFGDRLHIGKLFVRTYIVDARSSAYSSQHSYFLPTTQMKSFAYSAAVI